MTQEDTLAWAGLVAAGGVVAAKQLPLREPLPVGLSAHFRPSSLADLPRLFRQENETPFQRIARLSSAALVYSVNKKSPMQPGKLLRGPERERLRDLHQERQERFDTDRSCPHCRLLFGSMYLDKERWRGLPPIGVVNHRAHVEITFDPETNVSGARIEGFQVIVPDTIATQIATFSHPLEWATPAGSLFRRSDPVSADGTPEERLLGAPAGIQTTWEEMASDQAFLLEDVSWPVNGDLSADSENILAIRNFERTSRLLHYEYSLERCIRSNFGVAWEPSGLDIDGGEFTAEVVPVLELTAGTHSVHSGERLLNLMRRDILEMSAAHDPEALRRLYANELGSDTVDPSEAYEAVGNLAWMLQDRWPELGPFSLLTISASKDLHFTLPENNPIELWQLLTWTAPAILFTFLNRAVCQAPHLLIDQLVSEQGRSYAAV